MTESMTVEERNRCITAFQQFSWLKNGKIRVKKLARVMRRAGFAPTDEELEKVFQSCRGQANITEKMFLILMEEYKSDLQITQDLHEAFRLFDESGEGYFTISKLRDLLIAGDETLTEEDVEALCSQADSNGDGKVCFSGKYYLSYSFTACLADLMQAM
ncbi:Calmodulin [Echinococcus granulosus]|uniref:Calmodulin n=1 Tax=Echinococcus granulosus TaxID=6210 RepID=W6UZU3_ECHGR|nr:Calmodulin [Echinococcus granulosus]EUB64082.1 Calmodulin [Echinococcus granulosus]